MTLIYYLLNCLDRMIVRKDWMNNLVKTVGFRIGVLKFTDSYSFPIMSPHKIAQVYNIKSKPFVLMNTFKVKMAIIMY